MQGPPVPREVERVPSSGAPGRYRAALRPSGPALVLVALLLVGLGPVSSGGPLTLRGRSTPSLVASDGVDPGRLCSEPAGPAVDGRRDTTRSVARSEGPSSWLAPAAGRASLRPTPWSLRTERHVDADGSAAALRDPELSRPPPAAR